jgi:hypothetical protein
MHACVQALASYVQSHLADTGNFFHFVPEGRLDEARRSYQVCVCACARALRNSRAVGD